MEQTVEDSGRFLKFLKPVLGLLFLMRLKPKQFRTTKTNFGAMAIAPA
jgi:hypothetical protein